jgi:TonB family protein
MVPLTVAAVAFAAILTVPRLFKHHPGTQPTPVVSSEQGPGSAAIQKPIKPTISSKPNAKSDQESAVSQTAKAAAPPSQLGVDKRTAQPLAPHSLTKTSEEEQPAPASARASAVTPARGEAAKPAAAGIASAKGEVLDQVLPEVSQKARATIHGSVRVSVNVHVDTSGGVSDVELDSAGPSKFFADLALQAARKWAFAPPEVAGKSVASEWRLRFQFTQKDTKVTPTQTVP